MTLGEFIEMLRAIENETPFKVGFQLQHTSDNWLTLQELGERIHPTYLREFMERVEKAEPPDYEKELGI